MSRSLTERQRRFVDAYLVSRNASQAAREAGYAPSRHQRQGSDLLRSPAIIGALRARGIDPPHGVHPHTQIRKPGKKRPRTGLTLKEERFALAFLESGNATDAARRAGFTSDPEGYGCRLRHRPIVAAFIEAERAASIERTRIDVDRLKREYARLAFVDIADFIEWDEDGNIALKASADISPDDRAAIAELKVKPSEGGVKARVKLHDKQRALDSLARMMGLFGKKSFVTIDHEREKRDANAILRERLMRIVRAGEKEKAEKEAAEKGAGEKESGEKESAEKKKE